MSRDLNYRRARVADFDHDADEFVPDFDTRAVTNFLTLTVDDDSTGRTVSLKGDRTTVTRRERRAVRNFLDLSV